MRIADSHAHIFPDHLAEKASASIGQFYTPGIGLPASLQSLLDQQAKAGICVTAVSSSASSIPSGMAARKMKIPS